MELAQEVQARMTGLFPDTLGMRFTHASATCVRAELTVANACATDGILHGGVYGFADTLGAVGTILNLRRTQQQLQNRRPISFDLH